MRDIIYYKNMKSFRSNIFQLISNKKKYFNLRINTLKSQRKYYSLEKNLKLHMDEVLMKAKKIEN